MKFKLQFVLMAFIATLVFSSCGDDCELTTLSEVIVGEWELEINDNKGEVEFLVGGALSDPDGILIGGELGGVELDEKSYTVNSETSFTVVAEKGTNMLSLDLDVDSYECDKIILNFTGAQVEMKRK